jgi:hypothetical protein
MPRRLRILFLILVWTVGAVACTGEAPPPHSEQLLAWEPVGSWSGEANVQTESWTSTTGTFRFTWEAHDTGAEPGHLNIMLHSAVSGRPLVQAVDHTGNGKATIFVNEDPREFYVVVAAERTRWALKVDEGISLILTPTKR